MIGQRVQPQPFKNTGIAGLPGFFRAAKALQCGEVTINDCLHHGAGYFPFGGIKDSGMVRVGIGDSIDQMTNIKTIIFNLAARGPGKIEQDATSLQEG